VIRAGDIMSLSSKLAASPRRHRLAARLPRYLFLAATAALCLAGVKAILAPAMQAAPLGSEADAPDAAAESFAVGFARAYLSYDSLHREERPFALAEFPTAGLEAGAGFAPPRFGFQDVEWASVAQVQQLLAGGLGITVVAKVSTHKRPVYLSVPVKRGEDDALYIAAYPSFVGAPLSSAAGAATEGGAEIAGGELPRLVKRALTNYLRGDVEDLGADLAPAATVTIPTQGLRLTNLTDLRWATDLESGAVLATIEAEDSARGHYTLRYEVGVHHLDESDPGLAPSWRVTYIQTVSQEP
jgi:hypothetical protein